MAGERDSGGTRIGSGTTAQGTLVPVLRESGSMLLPTVSEQDGKVQPYLRGLCTGCMSERLPCQAVVMTHMSPWEDEGIAGME